MLARIVELARKAGAHVGFRRYAVNTAWMFAEQVLRIIAALFVGIYVARYLGPEQFGIYSYAAAFVSVLGAVAGLGLNGVVVRDLVKYPDRCNVYLGTAFWLKLAGALLVQGALAIAILFTSNDATTNLYIFIISIGLVFQSLEVVDFYFQSKVLSKYVSLCKLTQLTLSSILKLVFIYTEADLFWFVVVVVIDQVTLSFSLGFAWWHQKKGNFFGFFDSLTAKTMLKDAWPLIFSSVAIMLYMRIDQIMIKEMLGEREVGLYSAAVRLSEAWYFVPVIITSSLLPAIVNAKKASEELYYQRMQRLCTVTTWLAVALAVPMTFLAEGVVNIVFGQQFQGAGGVLAIHIWASVFVFMGVTSGAYFTVQNYPRKSLYRTVFGATTNIFLNLVLIPHYGVSGAAIATVLSQFAANYLYDVFDVTSKPLFIMKTRALVPIYLMRKKGV